MSSIPHEPAGRHPEPSVPLEAISASEARFEHWRKIAGVILTPVAFFAVYFATDTLKPEGRLLASILAAVGVLWATETLPLPITAVLGAVLCILLGVADARTVLAPFADPIVFLFIGSFILARAMTLHALDRRMALSFLSLPWIAGRPARVLGGLGLVTALLSMWVSNTATAAMMLPMALGILGALQQIRGKQATTRWPFATGMMLMVAYAASIGGIGTPVGSPPNLIGIALIRSLAGVNISFFAWMAMALPIFLVMGAVLYILLYLLHRPGPISPAAAAELKTYLHDQRDKLGPWTAGQRNTLIAFAVAVSLWLLPGIVAITLGSNAPIAKFLEARLPESIVALIAAILLFMLPVNLRQGQFTLTWSDAARIDWGTILLFGGGLSLGTLMFKTGVAEALGQSITGLLGASSLWALTAVAIAIAIFLSETTSNTASANMIIPVVIALAHAAGVNPVAPALGACLGASYGFMLPVSTPPNAIVYGSGLVPIPKMMRAGILFDLAGFFTILAGLRILAPLLGWA